jgi:hypothetical protein
MADGTPEVHAVNGLHRMQSTAPTHRPPRALSPPLPHHRLPPVEIRRLLRAFPGLVAAGAAAHRVYAAAPRYHWRRSLVCTPRPTPSGALCGVQFHPVEDSGKIMGGHGLYRLGSQVTGDNGC